MRLVRIACLRIIEADSADYYQKNNKNHLRIF